MRIPAIDHIQIYRRREVDCTSFAAAYVHWNGVVGWFVCVDENEGKVRDDARDVAAKFGVPIIDVSAPSKTTFFDDASVDELLKWAASFDVKIEWRQQADGAVIWYCAGKKRDDLKAKLLRDTIKRRSADPRWKLDLFQRLSEIFNIYAEGRLETGAIHRVNLADEPLFREVRH